MDGDSRYLSAEEQSRELTRSILREVGKLSEQWNNLIDRSDHWKHRLDEYMTVSNLNVYIPTLFYLYIYTKSYIIYFTVGYCFSVIFVNQIYKVDEG